MELYAVSTTVPILWMRKLRLREVQNHRQPVSGRENLKPTLVDPRACICHHLLSVPLGSCLQMRVFFMGYLAHALGM